MGPHIFELDSLDVGVAAAAGPSSQASQSSVEFLLEDPRSHLLGTSYVLFYVAVSV